MSALSKKLLRPLMVAVTAGLIFGPTTTAAFAANSGGGVSHGQAKAAVCKYVGTPGVDERLQTGQNPIVIDDKNYTVGDSFTDAQGRSVVIAILHEGDPAPPVSACPAPQGSDKKPVASVAPSTTPLCGPNNDGVTFPTQPVGVVLTSDTGWVNGQRTITYGAATGYVLTDSGVHTLVDANTPCLPDLIPIAPVAPKVTPVCGPNNDDVALQMQSEGAALVSDTGWVDNTRTIIYVAKGGYELTSPGIFVLHDENTPCQPELTSVAPVAPVVKAVCGPNDDNLTLKDQPAGVVLKSDTGWVDNTRTVTYVAAAGYQLEGSGVFTFNDDNVSCPPELTSVTAVNGTVLDYCGPDYNIKFVPASTEGVQYVALVQGNTLTVTAQVTDASKYVLTNPEWSQSATDELQACPEGAKQVTAVNGTFKDSCGPDFNLEFVPAVTEGVTYDVKHMGSDLVVTAGVTDQSKFVLTNPDFFQQATDKLEACPTTSTPSTPPSTTTNNTVVNNNTTVTQAPSNTVPAETAVKRGGSAQTGLNEGNTSGSPVLAVSAFAGLMVVGGVIAAQRRRTVRRPAHRA